MTVGNITWCLQLLFIWFYYLKGGKNLSISYFCQLYASASQALYLLKLKLWERPHVGAGLESNHELQQRQSVTD